MIVSHNEIVVTILKAFEALGLAQGQREDAAEAIGWLALHQQPFEDQLACALNQFSLRPNIATQLSHSAGASVWDAQGVSAIHIFPMLVDYAASQCSSAKSHNLIIKNLADIELMWPYMVKPMGRNYAVDCRWVSSAGWGRVVNSGDAGYPNLCWVSNFGDRLLDGEVNVTVAKGRVNQRKELEGQIVRIANASVLLEQQNESTQKGIQIDAALWDKLTAIGKGILVESTEESERRGAGGV